MDIDPNTLNLRSQGRWITAHLKTDDARAADLDAASLLLEGTLEPAWSIIQEESLLTAKFDRQAVQVLVAPADEVELCISGMWLDGEPFMACDTIRVIEPGG